MAQEYKLSQERLKELTDELTYLRTVREKEVAEQIKEARSYGDLSENSEYDEAKNEQGKLYSRIAEVENILSHAVLIDDKGRVMDKISLGSRIKVLDLDAEIEEDYTLVGSQEANPMEGKISDDAPFGKALMGKAVGDEINIEVPAGTLRYKVITIGG